VLIWRMREDRDPNTCGQYQQSQQASLVAWPHGSMRTYATRISTTKDTHPAKSTHMAVNISFFNDRSVCYFPVDALLKALVCRLVRGAR